jgi:hypothetical protein
MDDTCDILGIRHFRVSTGSTEPRLFFEAVCDQIGLPHTISQDKPALARLLVEGSGQKWLAIFSSRGSTITLPGLQAVRAAVTLFIQGEHPEKR